MPVRSQAGADAFLVVDTGYVSAITAQGAGAGLWAVLANSTWSIAPVGGGTIYSSYRTGATTYTFAEITLVPFPLYNPYVPLSSAGTGTTSTFLATERRVFVAATNGVLVSVRRGATLQPLVYHSSFDQDIPMNCVATNGRELCVGRNAGIQIVDTERPGRGYRWLMMDTLFRDIALARDGKLIASSIPHGMVEIDPVSGVWARLNAYPDQHIAYNPWTDMLASGQMFLRIQPRTAQLSQALFIFWSLNPSITDLGVNAEPPFLLMGHGCDNGLGREPRLTGKGLPLQGNPFHIELRDAEPGGFAFFWQGLNDTWSPLFGALPFDAGPLGAPGCPIQVAPDVYVVVPVDANGNATFTQTLPISPALSGLRFVAQSASTSVGNALGLATSEAVVVRTR